MTRTEFPSPLPPAAFHEAGWEVQEDDGFLNLVGPLWQRNLDGGPEFALQTDARHANRQGIVHGGVLMTLADRAMGGTARASKPDQRHATVQFDMHFVDATRIGELIEARCRVVRQTRSLIFADGTLTVGDRIVATVKGVWKVFGGSAGR
jgi:uncharacterized protein (TIGR00369 family)